MHFLQYALNPFFIKTSSKRISTYKREAEFLGIFLIIFREFFEEIFWFGTFFWDFLGISGAFFGSVRWEVLV